MNILSKKLIKLAEEVKQKYPRTKHLPWSPGATSDDIFVENIEMFEGKNVVVTEKMDGENCLEKDTLITTEEGDRTIQYICNNKYSGKVLSYNHDKECEEWKPIFQHIVNGQSDDWYRLEFEDGRFLLLTSNHRVWLPEFNCYRKVSELKGGEEVLLKNM